MSAAGRCGATELQPSVVFAASLRPGYSFSLRRHHCVTPTPGSPGGTRRSVMAAAITPVTGPPPGSSAIESELVEKQPDAAATDG
jgi:hypothetical protein